MSQGVRNWLYNRAWPSYDCQLCVGQEYWQGCYCSYYGASAPNCGPRWIEVALRYLYNWMYRNRIGDEH